MNQKDKKSYKRKNSVKKKYVRLEHDEKITREIETRGITKVRE